MRCNRTPLPMELASNSENSCLNGMEWMPQRCGKNTQLEVVLKELQSKAASLLDVLSSQWQLAPDLLLHVPLCDRFAGPAYTRLTTERHLAQFWSALRRVRCSPSARP